MSWVSTGNRIVSGGFQEGTLSRVVDRIKGRQGILRLPGISNNEKLGPQGQGEDPLFLDPSEKGM